MNISGPYSDLERARYRRLATAKARRVLGADFPKDHPLMLALERAFTEATHRMEELS